MTQTKMGQVQLRIMQLLWRMKRATARELTEELNAVPCMNQRVFESPQIAEITRQLVGDVRLNPSISGCRRMLHGLSEQQFIRPVVALERFQASENGVITRFS